MKFTKPILSPTTQYTACAMVSRLVELIIHLTIFFKQRDIEQRAAVYIVKGDDNDHPPVSRYRHRSQGGM